MTPPTILLVEDEPFTAQYEAQHLQKEGYRVLHVASGEAALAYVHAAHPSIDLILMDIYLGAGLDGAEVAQRILQDYDLPIVFLSSYADAEMMAKIEGVASYGYVPKNAGRAVLAAAIKMAFKLHVAHQATQRANARLREEIAARQQVEAGLRVNEQHLRLIFDTLSEGIALNEIVTNDQGEMVDYRVLQVNQAFYQQADYRGEQVVGALASELYGMTAEVMKAFWLQHRTKNTTAYTEMDSPLRQRCFVVSTSPFVNQQFVTSFFDITERKQAEAALQQAVAEKEMLMRELQHRVKNSLTLAISLLELEQTHLPDAHTQAIFDNTAARLRTVAALYEQLHQSHDLGVVALNGYLQTLVKTLAQAYLVAASPVQIETQLTPLELEPKRAIPLGLIVNELVTNALKYAFPAGRPGVIRVTLEADATQVRLGVADNGVGLGASASQGLGLMLVQMLAAQMGGQVTIESTQGVQVQVTWKK